MPTAAAEAMSFMLQSGNANLYAIHHTADGKAKLQWFHWFRLKEQTPCAPRYKQYYIQGQSQYTAQRLPLRYNQHQGS